GLNYIAQSGYVVACVDGRGTGGRSAEWRNCVYMHLGKYETQDQIAGANAIARMTFVDADRMSLFGWSYGGYMTLMEMSAENTPFKCGVAMAAVTDWRWYDSIYTERFMRTPAQNEAGYEESSAIARSHRLKGRLLIMSGSSDDNVHFYNTLKYTSKLSYEGRLFDMMVFTGMDHSLRTCNARTQLYRKVADFLDTNLK
ncbi:MAG: S9 family peptidase, partial [Muribaculaceae bacterium]|nr:S9 family peptidase [Muribaculaceae bacterium]